MSASMNGHGGEDLLVVEDLVKHFPVTRGIVFQKEVASVKAVDGDQLHRQAGRDPRRRGRVGLRQVDMARCLMRLLDPTAAGYVRRPRHHAPEPD